jgi:hypothetical protein
MTEIEQQYLLDYLREEFRKYPEVRLRVLREADEEGVMAKTESREYFFPTEWVRGKRFDLVAAEIRRMREGLPDRG